MAIQGLAVREIDGDLSTLPQWRIWHGEDEE